MEDILRFPFEPFFWLWTAIIIGVFVALPDSWTKKLTMQRNIGIVMIVAGAMLVMLLTGTVNFDAIRRSGPLVNVLKYLLHPLTIGWTFILVGIITALPDTVTDRYLSQDKFGLFFTVAAVVVLIFGVGVIRLDQIINPTLIVGIVIGFAIRHFGEQVLLSADKPIVRVPSTTDITPAPTVIAISRDDDGDDDETEDETVRPADSTLPDVPEA